VFPDKCGSGSGSGSSVYLSANPNPNPYYKKDEVKLEKTLVGTVVSKTNRTYGGHKTFWKNCSQYKNIYFVTFFATGSGSKLMIHAELS
jgi:hypothetical protein